MPFCRPCKPPIELPKYVLDPAKSHKLCKCYPTCHSRRREWKGVLLKTSAELLLEKKPKRELKRRTPKRAKEEQDATVTVVTEEEAPEECETKTLKKSKVVVLCQAPLDLSKDTTYLKCLEIAKKCGAWKTVKKSHRDFCMCPPCCTCRRQGYSIYDADQLSANTREMKTFDRRMRTDLVYMQNMYSILPQLRDIPGCTR